MPWLVKEYYCLMRDPFQWSVRNFSPKKDCFCHDFAPTLWDYNSAMMPWMEVVYDVHYYTFCFKDRNVPWIPNSIPKHVSPNRHQQDIYTSIQKRARHVLLLQLGVAVYLRKQIVFLLKFIIHHQRLEGNWGIGVYSQNNCGIKKYFSFYSAFPTFPLKNLEMRKLLTER